MIGAVPAGRGVPRPHCRVRFFQFTHLTDACLCLLPEGHTKKPRPRGWKGVCPKQQREMGQAGLGRSFWVDPSGPAGSLGGWGPSLGFGPAQAGLQLLHHSGVCKAKPMSQGPSPGWQWDPFWPWGACLWGSLWQEESLLRSWPLLLWWGAGRLFLPLRGGGPRERGSGATL